MANKALAKRQRMQYQADPMQRVTEPHTRTTVTAKQRATGLQGKKGSTQPRLLDRLLKGRLLDPNEKE